MKPFFVVVWLVIVGAVFWATLSDTIVGSSQLAAPSATTEAASSTTKPSVPEAVQTALPTSVLESPALDPDVDDNQAQVGESSEIHILETGTVAISYRPSLIRVLWASPREGHTVSSETVAGKWSVSFSGDGITSTIESWWDAGPQWTIQEDQTPP